MRSARVRTVCALAASALLLAGCGSDSSGNGPNWKPKPSFNGEGNPGGNQQQPDPNPPPSTPGQQPSSSAPSQGPASDPAVVAKHLSAPTGIAILPDNTALVGERTTARIVRVQPQPGKPVRTLRYPGTPEHRHAWAYLPDVAQTAARLLDREAELAAFERFHFGGYFVDGRELCDAVRRASGNANVRLGRFPWWLVTLAAPFVVTLRELRKMRYLWRTPIALDDRKLVGFLGDDCYTPLEQALRRTLDGLGCLPATCAAVPAQA